jgi:urease alpha subunit
MTGNSFNPEIEVDPKSARVVVDGAEVTSEAVTEVPLNRLYMLS